MIGEDDGGGGSLSGGGGGGGKMRKRRGRSGAAKPYDRPQSILNRVGNVLGALNPIPWISRMNWSPVESVPEEDEDEDAGPMVSASRYPSDNADVVASPIVATSRSALNSFSNVTSFDAPTLRTSSMMMTTTTTENGFNYKEHHHHRIPMPSATAASTSMSLIWNPVNEAANRGGRQAHHISSNPPPDPTLAGPSKFMNDFDDGAVASTSASSFASPNPVSPFLAASRTNKRRQSSSSSSASSSRNNYARLSDIAKLSNNVSSRRGVDNSSKNDGGDSQSECSEDSVSTSGCSSMVPHPDKRDYQRDILQMSKPALCQLSANLQAGLQSKDPATSGGRGHDGMDDGVTMSASNSRLQGRQNDGERTAAPLPFLFSENAASYRARPQPLPSTTRPQFNSFLFGSPTLTDKSDIRGSNSFAVSYPYTNKVSYGFGSTSRQMSRPNSTAPYNTPGRRKVQVRSLNTGDGDLMSPTTRRILETLEAMSTPIMDAKRIPSSIQDPDLDTPLSFTTTAYRRRPSLSTKTSSNIARIEATNSIVSRGPPISKLMTPGSVALTRNIPRNVEVSSSHAQNVSLVPSVQPPSITVTEPQREERSSKTNAGGKMRIPRQNAAHYSRAVVDTDFAEPPQLQSLPLNIGTLPKFDFLKSNNASWSALNASASSGSAARDVPELIDISSPKFSSPIANQAIDSAFNTRDNQQGVSQFTFREPLSIAEHESDTIVQIESPRSEQDSSLIMSESPKSFPVNALKSGSLSTPGSGEKITTLTFKAPSSVKPVLKLKAPADIDESIEDNSKLAGGFGVASELKTGSVMDILRKSNSSHQQNTKIVDLGAKPASTTLGFGDRFKSAAGSWECPTCMVSNNVDASMCIACETKKPSASQNAEVKSSSAAMPTGSEEFDDKFIPPAGTWSCPECMLRVDKDKIKCPACETSKPEAMKQSSTSQDTPSRPWVCDTCFVRNSSTASRCAACEVPKPGSQSTTALGSFKFGFPATSNSSLTPMTTQTHSIFGVSSTTTTTSAPTTTITPAFKFGIPSSTATPPSSSSTTPAIFPFGLSKSDTLTSSSFSSDSKETLATFKFGLGNATKKQDGELQSPPTGFKMPSSLPLAAAAAAATDIPSNTLSSAADVSKTTAGATDTQFVFQPPPVRLEDSSISTSLNLVARSASPSPLLNSTPIASSGFMVDKTIATPTLTSPVLPNSDSFKTPFSFGGAKQLSEKPTTTASSLPAESFSFKFSSVESKTAMAASTVSSVTPSFVFGSSSSSSALGGAKADSIKPIATGTKEVTTAGGFPFTFGAPQASSTHATGTKRSADDSDGAISSKKAAATTTAGASTFGFGQVGTPAPTAATPSGFSFGSMPVTRSQPASGPIFGALSTTTDKSPSSNTFTFGANTSASPSRSVFGASQAFSSAATRAATPIQLVPPQQTAVSQTPSLAFNFKQVSPAVITTTAATASAAAPSTYPSFSFGSQTTTTATNANNNIPFGSSASSAAFGSGVGSQSSVPIFGAQPSNNATPPSFGGFGALAPSSSVTNSVFGGGAAASGSVTGTNAATFSFGSSPAGGFQFGASASQEPGVFTFTANQSSHSGQTNPNAGFAFGQQQQQHQQQQQQQPSVVPPSGFNFNPSNQLNFNFGNAAGSSNQPPMFNTQQNPFDAIGSASRPPAGRAIKKAKRRTQK